MLFGAGKRTKNGNLLGVVVPIPIVGILVICGVVCMMLWSIVSFVSNALIVGTIVLLSSRTFIVLGCCFAASYLGWTTTTETWTKEKIKRVLIVTGVLVALYTFKYWWPVAYDIFMWGPRSWKL